ncbi:hypothetical protein SK128_010366, partial [Halocaridina rubra]
MPRSPYTPSFNQLRVCLDDHNGTSTTSYFGSPDRNGVSDWDRRSITNEVVENHPLTRLRPAHYLNEGSK